MIDHESTCAASVPGGPDATNGAATGCDGEGSRSLPLHRDEDCPLDREGGCERCADIPESRAEQRARMLDALAAFEDVYRKAQTEADTAYRQARRAEVALAEFDGEGDSLRIRWVRAWLAGDHASCDRLLDLRHPDQAEVKRPATEEEKAALRAEAARMSGRAA